MKKTTPDNFAFIYRPKEKNPYNGNWDYEYLVPAVKNQKGKNHNYIVVTCAPQYNGVYAWDASKKYDTWQNGKLLCYYVPRSECVYKTFDEIPERMREMIKPEVIKQQKQWFTNQVKNRDYTYKKMPSWMWKDE